MSDRHGTASRDCHVSGEVNWQIEANRAAFIRKRAEQIARLALHSPALDYQQYLEIAEKELIQRVKWAKFYYAAPPEMYGVCPESWAEFYKMEEAIASNLRYSGQSEHERYMRSHAVEDDPKARARRNAEVENSLAHHRNQVARHSGRTTAQQKEHERSGNYPW